MKNIINLEVILVTELSSKDSRQKELVKWLTTTVQFIIEKQHERTRKRSLRIWEDTAPICMS
jgi:hypothetical protein